MKPLLQNVNRKDFPASMAEISRAAAQLLRIGDE
jgi:hypothetical protein